MTVGAEWVAAVISKNGCDGIAQPGPALFIVHPLTGPWCVVCEDLLHVTPVYRRPPKSPAVYDAPVCFVDNDWLDVQWVG